MAAARGILFGVIGGIAAARGVLFGVIRGIAAARSILFGIIGGVAAVRSILGLIRIVVNIHQRLEVAFQQLHDVVQIVLNALFAVFLQEALHICGRLVLFLHDPSKLCCGIALGLEFITDLFKGHTVIQPALDVAYRVGTLLACRRLIGHFTENAIDTGNDLLIDHGRHVLCVLIQQIIMQNDHITLDRLICGIVLNGEGVDRRIEIIVVVEVCHQILQTLIGCVIRNAVCLVAQNHAVGQLLMLIILTVIHHLHADTGLGFHLHNKQNVILFLGFTREAVQLLVGILQEHIVLCVFLDVSGDGFHLVKHVIGFGRTLQAVEHCGNSAVVFVQICVQLVKLALQLVVFLLQLSLLCLRLGDQATHRHGLGNDLTLLVLLGHRSGRALHVGNFLLHFSNTQLLQLMIDHTHG